MSDLAETPDTLSPDEARMPYYLTREATTDWGTSGVLATLRQVGANCHTAHTAYCLVPRIARETFTTFVGSLENNDIELHWKGGNRQARSFKNREGLSQYGELANCHHMATICSLNSS